MTTDRRALIWVIIIFALMLLACYLLTDNTRADPLEVQNRTYHEIRQGIGGSTTPETIRARYEGDKPTVFPVRPSSKRALTSEFGLRYSPTSGAKQYHPAIDIAGRPRCEILATMAGAVWASGYNPVDGYYLILIHDNGWRSRYCHLNNRYVSPGDKVEAGQVIGRMGNTGRSTGFHLHFELWQYGGAVDPQEHFDIVPGEGRRF